jgi:Tol biopolymer transport system component
MRKATCTLLFILTFVVSGCAAPAVPTKPPVDTPTSIAPTLTFIPTPTVTEPPETPTLTPEPGLRTNGPYFTYFREVDGVYQLVMMDADGGGRKVVDLPQGFVDSLTNQQYGLDMKFVSPNGKWLAFYAGSAGDLIFGQDIGKGPFNLTLNLLDLTTGQISVVTPLLSQDYPNNFAKAEKQINRSDITALDLGFAFLAGITQAHAWSPDGRYLAFAGQMDGLSSDLYVYDMQTKKIQRLSSGDEELQWIDWSPDDKWIVYGSTFWAGEGTQFHEYAVMKDGSSTHDFLNGYVDSWLNSHEFFEFDSANGWGDFNLRMVDVNTGKITTIWKGIFHEYKIDPNKDWVALVAITSVLPSEEERPNFIPGLQLINLKSLQVFQNPDPLSEPPDTFLRAEDGRIVPLPAPAKPDDKIISASPDTKYWAIVLNQDVKIYSKDLSLVKEISIPLVKSDDVQWNPNSSNFFLVADTDIFSVNISTGVIYLIETNLLSSNYGLTAYKWLNGQ